MNYDKVVKLLLEGDKGKSPKPRSESIKKLANLKDSQQKALKKYASISFKEKDGKGYFQIPKDARSLTNRIFDSEASAETIAAYMLVTYSHPGEIREDVESLHNLQPKKDKKEKASVNVTQEDQRSGQSSSEPSQREERTREGQTRKTNEKTRTPRSSSSEPTFSEDGRHAIINGKLFVHKRGRSRDSGSGSATSGEDSDDSGSRFNSDESAFDQADDDRSPPRSTKSKSTRRKSRHKSGGSV